MEDQSNTLATLSHSAAAMLGEGLAQRLHEVELLASYPARSPDDWSRLVSQAQASRTHYSWLGVVDPSGLVVAAKDGMLVGQSVASRPWFKEGMKGAHAGDVHPANLLAGMLPASKTGEPLRFVDFAAPVRDTSGRVSAVVAVHANWDWAFDVVRALDDGTESRGRAASVQVFILDRKGEVIHRPLGVPSDLAVDRTALPHRPTVMEWSDGASYLTAASPVLAVRDETDMGWVVVTRQPVEVALAGGQKAFHAAVGFGLALSLMSSVIVWAVVGALTRPLRKVAAAARDLRPGDLTATLPVYSGSSEVRELTTALQQMTDGLHARERELEEANRSLERRVLERTAELAQANETLRRLATSDCLTELPNRRSIEASLSAEMLRHRRTRQPLALVMCDIDRFKQVNDNHGHVAGDDVIRKVARALRQGVRETDLVGRLGGEEFMILMPNTTEEGARIACEKLRARIEASREGVAVTASFGVVAPAQYFVSPSLAVVSADQALYQAKEAGRNRVCVFTGQTPAEAVISGFAELDAA